MASLKKKNQSQISLTEVLIEADISRLLGNEDWRKVFIRRLDSVDPPKHASTLRDMASMADARLLDIAWAQHCAGDPIADMEAL